MDNLEKTCFFTGHRIMSKEKIDLIAEELENNIVKMYKNGVKNFISGGALGFDTMAASAVIKLKKTEYPDIKLFLYIPCYDYGENWNYEQRCNFHLLKCNADDVLIVSKENYFPECMKIRNEKMVNDSDLGIAYKVLNRSGTGQTVAIAKKKGLEVINIADIVNI